MPRPQRKRTIYQLPGCRFFRAEPEEDPGTVGPEKAGERGKESGTGRLAGPSEEKMAEEKEAVCFVLRLGLFGLKSCWQKNELCHFLHP